MKAPAHPARPVLPPALTATHVVRFEQRPKLAPRRGMAASVGRVPRVARLLAFAHRIDGMIRSGELRDWAAAARLARVTRARMTQIGNLLLLAPKIQEDILNLSPAIRGHDPVSEHALREVAAHADWQRQRTPSLEPEHCPISTGSHPGP